MDYKTDIINTRVGCVGSSDGAMLERIARDGAVPASFAKRMAVIKGIIPSVEGFKTKQMEYGDKVENVVFDTLHSTSPEYISNPRWESDIYKGVNVRLISHPDIVRFDEEHHTLHIYEVKATHFPVEQTLETYRAQLYIHEELGKEQVMTKPETWRVKVHLVHYLTDGTGTGPVNLDNITIKDVVFDTPPFNLMKAVEILDHALDTFTYSTEEVDSESLPEVIQGGMAKATMLMAEIKTREAQIDEFKKALYIYMTDNDIKSVRNDQFTITRVDPTETHSFDSKAYLRELAKTDPTLEADLRKEYDKVTKRSGYALIKLK